MNSLFPTPTQILAMSKDEKTTIVNIYNLNNKNQKFQ